MSDIDLFDHSALTRDDGRAVRLACRARFALLSWIELISAERL